MAKGEIPKRIRGALLSARFLLGLAILAFACVNGAELLAQEPGAVAAADRRVQTRTYIFPETGKKVPYALFVPSDYDKGRKWPLLVGLHGAGNPFNALMGYEGIVDLAQRDGYILVTPLGYNAFGWYGSAGSGLPPGQGLQSTRKALDEVEAYFGSGVNAFEAGEVQEPVPANLGELSEKDVMNVLDIARKEFNVDPDRIYLWGHSMGGGGTYHLAAKYPDIWAAIAVVAPVPDATLDQLRKFGKIPTLVLQGDADDIVAKTRGTVAKMKQLGMEHVYIEIRGGDHALIRKNTAALSKIFSFFNIVQKNQRPASN